jgi:hypothetical protein
MNGLLISAYRCSKSSVTGLYWSRAQVILLPQWRTRPPQRKPSASSPDVKTSIIKSVAIARIRILSGLLSGITTLILLKYPLINHHDRIVSLSSYVCNVLGYIAALVCTSGQLIFVHPQFSCHILSSFVRSISMDTWQDDQVKRMQVTHKLVWCLSAF